MTDDDTARPQPAGWYEDPHDPNFQRLWDGSEWTGQTRVVPPPTRASTAVHRRSHLQWLVVGMSLAGAAALALDVTAGVGLAAFVDIAISQELPSGAGLPWRQALYTRGALVAVPMALIAATLVFARHPGWGPARFASFVAALGAVATLPHTLANRPDVDLDIWLRALGAVFLLVTTAALCLVRDRTEGQQVLHNTESIT